MRRTIDQGANRFLPLVVLVEVIAFKIVAARKAKESRMQSGKFLHQVDALSVGLVLVCRRKQRYQREPCGSRVLHQKFQMIVGGGSDHSGLESEFVSLPCVAGGGT